MLVQKGKQVSWKTTKLFILFDIWTELYGENFARAQVNIEPERMLVYKEAWEWALLKDKYERQAEFKSQLW